MREQNVSNCWRAVAFAGADQGQRRARKAAQRLHGIECFQPLDPLRKARDAETRQDALNDSFCACATSPSGMPSTSCNSMGGIFFAAADQAQHIAPQIHDRRIGDHRLAAQQTALRRSATAGLATGLAIVCAMTGICHRVCRPC